MKHIFGFRFYPILLLCLSLTVGSILISCNGDKPKVTYKYNDNTVRVRLGGEPDRISPLLTRSGYTRYVHEQVFMTLLDFNPQTLEMEPVLAKSVPSSESLEEGPYAGGMSYTFEIRDEAVWDDGTPVTAADVDFTLKLIFTPGLPTGVYRPYYEFFKAFETDPANPKRFTVYAANKYILNEPAIATLAPYPKHIYDPEGVLDKYSLSELNQPDIDQKYGDKEDLKRFAEQFTSPKYSREKEGVSGAGPYAFEAWESGQYILLKKKTGWWGEKLAGKSPFFEAHPDELMFKIIPDQAAAITALKDQEIDATAGIDSKDFVDIGSMPIVTDYYNLYSPNASQIYLLYLNNKDPKLSDKRVRKALAHLLDVDEFITSLYDGLAERVTGPFLSSKPYYNKNLKPIQYNEDKAAELLNEAGWKDSNSDGILDKDLNGKQTDLELSINASSAKASQNLALFFQNSLQKAGIKVNIITKEFRELMTDVRKKDYQIYLGAMGLDLTLDDPKQQWHTESDNPSGGNYSGFGNASSDSLINAIRTTLDESERNKMYMEFQEMLYDETPAIFLFTPKERIAIHKRFEAEPSLKRPGFFPNTFELRKEQ